MAIGPIQPIRPIPPVTGPRVAPDLGRVFAAEFNRQQGGDAEQREESRRGLDADPDDEMEDASQELSVEGPVSTLDLIA